MTSTTTPTTTTRKATKRARRSGNGPTKADLEQRALDATAAADAARAETEELRAQLDDVLERLGQPGPVGPPPTDDHLPLSGEDLARFTELCRRPFPASAMGVLNRSWCRECSAMRGRGAHCKTHSWVQTGKCPWTYTAGDGSTVQCQGDHTWAVNHFTYVGHAALTRRLLEIDPGWDADWVAKTPSGNPDLISTESAVMAWMRLTLCGITHMDIGVADRGNRNSLQDLYGNALRRCAMRFGIALELWSKEELEDFAPPGEDPGDPDAPPAGEVEEELASPADLAELNDEIALIADDKTRAAVRRHIRRHIRKGEQMTKPELGDALAYVKTQIETGDESGQEPPGDAATGDPTEQASPDPGGQDDGQAPASPDSGSTDDTAVALERVEARLLTFTGPAAQALKTALEDCDLWPPRDHPDELPAVWEVMNETEAELAE